MDLCLNFGSFLQVSTRQALLMTFDLLSFCVLFFCPPVCVLFSWIGYIVSCCLASSVAAQAGAAAGLGLSLVIKTILVEVAFIS